MSPAGNNGSFNLKPHKPEPYDGRRNYLTVNAWLYIMEQYFNLSQMNSRNISLSDSNKTAFASS